MKGPITIDAGADIKQLEDVDVITIHNKYVSVAVTRLEGDATNRSRLIYRIQQIWSIKKIQ